MDDDFRVLDSLSEKKGGGEKKIRTVARKPEPQPINSDITRDHWLGKGEQCLDIATCLPAQSDSGCQKSTHRRQEHHNCCFFHALGTSGGSEARLHPAGCTEALWKYDDRYYEGRENW
jgi:hypothetical protein